MGDTVYKMNWIIWLGIVLVVLCSVADTCRLDKASIALAKERLAALDMNITVACDRLVGGAADSAILTAVSAKLFLFHNNEVEVLADWLQYHSHVFGFDNIVVIDHQSNVPAACDTLAIYQTCGVRIINYKGSFQKKYEALTKAMKGYKDAFLIPLDCDEFIALPIRESNGSIIGYTSSREKIRMSINKLVVDGRKYKFSHVYPVYNRHDVCIASLNHTDAPGPVQRRVLNGICTGNHQYADYQSKTFFFSEGFISTDQGNHFGEVRHDQHHTNMNKEVVSNLAHYFATSELALLHYSATSYYSMKQKMIRGAAAYGYHRGDETCVKTKLGYGYCVMARDYRANSASSRKHYMSFCEVNSTIRNVSVEGFRKWFVDNSAVDITRFIS
jgi:hypothetical protein